MQAEDVKKNKFFAPNKIAYETEKIKEYSKMFLSWLKKFIYGESKLTCIRIDAAI